MNLSNLTTKGLNLVVVFTNDIASRLRNPKLRLEAVLNAIIMLFVYKGWAQFPPKVFGDYSYAHALVA